MRGKLHQITLLSIFVFLLQFTFGNICQADVNSEVELMRNYLKNQQWPSALSQLNSLISTYPDDAASFIVDDQNKKLWGSKLSDAMQLLKQVADSSNNGANDLKLKIALIDCYKKQNDWPKAFSLIESLKIDYPNQQCVYHNLKAICYYQGQDYDTALDEVKQALKNYAGPNDEKTLIDSVLNCSSSDKKLIKAAYVLIRYSPYSDDLKKAELFKWAGQLCQYAGRSAEAIQVMKKALQFYDSAGATEKKSLLISNILDSYKAAGLTAEAEAFTKSIRKDDPKSVIACEKKQLMHAYLEDKKYEDALSIAKYLLDNYNDEHYAIDALTVAAECLYPLGRGQEALDLQDQFFKNHPELEKEAAWLKVRNAYYAQGDPAKTDKSIREFLVDHPESPYAKELLASNLLWRLKKTDEAKTVYKDLLSTSFDNVDIRYNLAYCSYVEKDYTAAKEAFQYICDNFSNINYQASSVYMAGDCSARTGDVDEAKKAFNKVINDYPSTNIVARAMVRLAELDKTEKETSR